MLEIVLQRKRESQGPRPPKYDKSTKPGSVTNRGVYSDTDESPGEAPAGVPDPLDLLLSDSDEESGVWRIELNDTGSEPKCAPVLVQGVPAKGIIDSGSEITIMGAHLFKKVAMTAHLRKRDLKPRPRGYDQ